MEVMTPIWKPSYFSKTMNASHCTTPPVVWSKAKHVLPLHKQTERSDIAPYCLVASPERSSFPSRPRKRAENVIETWTKNHKAPKHMFRRGMRKNNRRVLSGRKEGHGARGTDVLGSVTTDCEGRSVLLDAKGLQAPVQWFMPRRRSCLKNS